MVLLRWYLFVVVVVVVSWCDYLFVVIVVVPWYA